MNTMKTMKTGIILGLSFLFMIANPFEASAKKKIELKYKLSKNEKFVSKTNIDQNVEMEANGQTMNIQIVMNIDILTKVSKVEKNSIETSNAIQKITMGQTMFGQTLNFDSSKPETYASGQGKQIGAAMNKLLNKSYTLSIDDWGNLVGFNMDKLTEGGNNVSGDITSGTDFIVFPKHKVSVGDTWEAAIKPLKNSPANVYVKYTLKKISGNKAIIDIEGTIKGRVVDGKDMHMTGYQSGVATVNIKNGWTTNLKIDQEIKMTLDKNGTKIPMTVNATITRVSVPK